MGTFEQEKKRTLKAIRRRLKRIEKGILGKEKSLDESLKAQKFYHYGDLLKANFTKLKPKLSEITVLDWLNENQPVTLTLDPDLLPQEQLEEFYKKSKKLKRATKPLEKIINELKTERLNWKGVEGLVLVVETERELFELQKKHNLLEKSTQLSQKQHEKEKLFHTFFSESGFTILVGKNASANDQLTFQVAHGDDLWLHVSGKAGSHVVVRSKKNKPVDQETILDAANLALYFSKARADAFSQHEVHITTRRFVQRIKGAPKGKVMISSYKTLNLTQDPLRIENIKKRKSL